MPTSVPQLTPLEKLNFLITNRIPRKLATRFVGWYSKLELGWITSLTIRLWQLFVDDLRLDESASNSFKSVNDCFTRQLKPGARPLVTDKDVLISPCDAIVGAHGPIDGTTIYQVKGYPYDLEELIPDSILQSYFRDGIFITLRLKSSMYHHFHAPADGTLRHITYCSGDTWNVNPIALQCVQKLFCKNERALLEYELDHNRDVIALVPVAAILVASLKLQCLDSSLNMNYTGQTRMACLHSYRRGDRLGHFEHGSTIICLAPAGYSVCSSITENSRINMGEALLRRDQ